MSWVTPSYGKLEYCVPLAETMPQRYGWQRLSTIDDHGANGATARSTATICKDANVTGDQKRWAR